MTAYEWVTILAFAGGVIERAIRVAEALIADGCTVRGCPDAIAEEIQPADIPRAGDAWRRASAAAHRRARGLDRATIETALGQRVWTEAELRAAAVRAGPTASAVIDSVLRA